MADEPIAEHHRSNFETLEQAFVNGDVCLLACTDKTTGVMIPTICAMKNSGDDEAPIEFVPLAKMFLGVPYDEIDPPQ
jgi:hypothetical protein